MFQVPVGNLSATSLALSFRHRQLSSFGSPGQSRETAQGDVETNQEAHYSRRVAKHDGMARFLHSRSLLLELKGRTFAIRNGEKKTREFLLAEEMLLPFFVMHDELRVVWG